MKSFTLRISLAASLLILLSLVGALPTRSDSAGAQLNKTEDRARKPRSRSGLKPLSYRSPGATHKLMLPADDPELEQQLLSMGVVRKMKKYRAYSVAEVGDAELGSLNAATLERASLRDDLNLVLLKRGQLDTTGPAPIISDELRQPETATRALHLVQLFGPPTTDSLKAITATGAKIVGYIPNNAYLIWTTRPERQQLHAMQQSVNGSTVIQWDGPYHPAYKVDPHIKLDSVEQIRVSIAILDTPGSDDTVAHIKSVARATSVPEYRVSGITHVNGLIESFRVKDLASMPSVIAIERAAVMRPLDERQDQIVAGVLTQQTVNNLLVSKPAAPGYLSLLQSAGLSSDFDFAVDVGDTGFDVGSVDPTTMHPAFLNAVGTSRIAYLHDFSGDLHPGPTHDPIGHGTLTASIVGGFSDKSGDAFKDSLGFEYGLGVAPFARIGVSKLFTDAGDFVAPETYVQEAYRSGARIYSNSWGACDDTSCNLYDTSSQIFDSFVRDTDPQATGNQEGTFVFAAGNDGDPANGGFGFNSISSPGTAKNVITVGGTKGFRPTDANGNPLKDACNWPASYADNAQDILSISSSGLVQDGRTKPDIVAPASHIVGAATQDPQSIGICGLGRAVSYFPPGQTLFTWATGTSFSTPAVAGGAALVYQWLNLNRGVEPSPALVKAFLLNSASYLPGQLAGDTLPGNRQGWGLMNLGRAFEQTDRIVYDEDASRTFTTSGGAPFEVIGTISDPSKEFRLMLVWTDAPGSDVTNAPYVNQLNLEVVVDGVVYSGNHFSGQYSTAGGQQDFTNNVQGVRLPVGTTGPFVIRVRPTVIAGDGVPGDNSPLDQDFALVVTNGRETAIPVLTVDSAGDVSAGVTVQHSSGTTDSSLIAGESAKIVVTVKNQSQTAAASIQAASLALGGSQTSSTFQDIAAGQTGTNAAPFQIQIPSGLRCGSVATLQLQLDTNAGRFTLPVRVQVGRPSTAGGPAETLLFDDVDNSTVKWKMKGGFGPASGTATSGTMAFHTQDAGNQNNNDSRQSQLFTKKGFVIPANAGQVRLSFFHIFNFEPGYDGGVLEISTDGGDYQDAGSLILVGGYDGKVTAASNNPLGSRFAWTARGRPGVFSQVVVDLSDFAGKRVRLRFLAGFDNATGIADGYTGWFIDDIQVTAVMYSCGQAQSADQTMMTESDGRGPVKVTRIRQRIE